MSNMGEGRHLMTAAPSEGASPARVITGSPARSSRGVTGSPSKRRTKIKVSGGTQTAEDLRVTSQKQNMPWESSQDFQSNQQHETNWELTKESNSEHKANNRSFQETSQHHQAFITSSLEYRKSPKPELRVAPRTKHPECIDSPQRTITAMAAEGTSLQLSETTKERLLASQRRCSSAGGYKAAQSRGYKTRTRRPRECPPVKGSKQMNAGLSDSGDSVYAESNQGTNDQTIWYTAYNDAENGGNNLRVANSLESIDSVSNSIQQARANSLNPIEHLISSPQLLRINRSNSVSCQMTGRVLENQRTLPLRKVSDLKDSEYYGIPLQQKEGRNSEQLAKKVNHLASRITDHQVSRLSDQQASRSSDYLSGRISDHQASRISDHQVSRLSDHQASSLNDNWANRLSDHQVRRLSDQEDFSQKRPQLYSSSGSFPRTLGRRSIVNSNMSASANEEVGRGSMSSLVSLGHLSSVSFLSEEKVNSEIQKLRKELREEQEKVQHLSSQLSTNAHVVSAFEQSLSNMTTRLQQLTRSADQKDKELNDLRKTTESLRQQGADLGFGKFKKGSNDSIFSRNNSFTTSDSENEEIHSSTRKVFNFKQKKSQWLQQSLCKAFSRTKKLRGGSVSEVEDTDRRTNIMRREVGTSCPGSPLSRGHHRSKSEPALDDQDTDVKALKQQLIQKENILTETRLEALSSAHQLQSLRETISRLRSELIALRKENEQLHQDRQFMRLSSDKLPEPDRPSSSLVRGNDCSLKNSHRSHSTSPNSHVTSPKQRHREADMAGDRKGRSPLQISCRLEADMDEVSVPVSIISPGLPKRPEVKIGHVAISRNSSWVHLDECLRGLVRTYLSKLDPESNLELSNQSMVCYQCGNIRRVLRNPVPDHSLNLLPDTRIWVSFGSGKDRSSMEDLSFTTLIPKSVIKKYVSTLAKHQRALIIGHPGFGKTFLAKKLAEFLVLKSGEKLTSDSVSVFWANKASTQQCQNYVEMLSHLLTTDPNKVPSVIIMENINAQGNKMTQIFDILGESIEDTPFIICTTTPTQHIPDLVKKHHFAEIQLGEDVEVMQGFLGRFLRKKMLNIEFATRLTNHDMPDAIQWILRIYCNLYIFVKTTSNTHPYFSPQMFLACPVDSTAAMQSWFIDLWNSSLVSYLRQVVKANVREDVIDFEDPVRFVIRTWPWLEQSEGLPQALLKVKIEKVLKHVNKDGQEEGDEIKDDPLLSMLLCLQEAALCSGDSENLSSDMSSQKLSAHNSSSDVDKLSTS